MEVNERTPATRVLVVDDNDDVRVSFCLLLKLLGFEPRAVSDGAKALRAVEEYRPHVVFMDLNMPHMDGLEAARKIRKAHSGKIFLVAVTGLGQPGDRKRTKEAGFFLHVMKPITVEDVQKILHRAPDDKKEVVGLSSRTAIL